MTPNYAARLARRLMIAAWRPSGRARLSLLGILALLWIGGAAWAAWRRDLQPEQALPFATLVGDILYAPLTYLSPQPDYADGGDMIWQAQVARLAGPLWGITGLLLAFHRAPLAALARWMTRHHAASHALIWGEEGSGDAVAIASSRAGEPVALIDASLATSPARRSLLGREGVVLFDMAAGADAGFDLAGGARAAGFAVIGASDAAGLSTALDLRGRFDARPHDLLVAINAPQVQRAIRQAPDLLQDGRARLRPFSIAGNAVRSALADTDLVAQAVMRGHSRVTLCLWGNSEALQWAAEYALKQCWSVSLGAPRLLLAMPDESRNPLIDATALRHLAAHSAVVFEPDNRPEIAASTGAETAVTRHLVDLGEDTATLGAAFDLAGRLRQSATTPSPVQAIVRATNGLAALYSTQELTLLPPIAVGAAPSMEKLVARRLDALAADLHLDYAERFGGSGVPADGDWRTIPETYVAANRAAADHQAVKRWDVANSALKGDTLMEALAVIEHRRWCAERLLDGWAPSGKQPRDNARRLHPKLVPWAALDQQDQARDQAQVAAALSPGNAG